MACKSILSNCNCKLNSAFSKCVDICVFASEFHYSVHAGQEEKLPNILIKTTYHNTDMPLEGFYTKHNGRLYKIVSEAIKENV